MLDSLGGPASGVSGARVRMVGSARPSYTFTGLTNGVAYRFVVREKNAHGFSGASARSAAIVPAANARPNILFILTDDQRYDAVRSFRSSTPCRTGCGSTTRS